MKYQSLGHWFVQSGGSDFRLYVSSFFPPLSANLRHDFSAGSSPFSFRSPFACCSSFLCYSLLLSSAPTARVFSCLFFFASLSFGGSSSGSSSAYASSSSSSFSFCLGFHLFWAAGFVQVSSQRPSDISCQARERLLQLCQELTLKVNCRKSFLIPSQDMTYLDMQIQSVRFIANPTATWVGNLLKI